jgi:hypothetical protein
LFLILFLLAVCSAIKQELVYYCSATRQFMENPETISSSGGYPLCFWLVVNVLLDRVSTPKVSAALASLLSSVTRILLFFFASARYAES